MHTETPNGAEVYREAYFRGLRPDPSLWVDQWADEYMRIPRDTGAAEPGQYRTSRTPYAREPMRCLSPAHPCTGPLAMPPKVEPVLKVEPPKIDQKIDINAPLQITVKGDVKDPAALARELQPHLQRQMEQIGQQMSSRNLYDAPHVG